MDNGQLTMENGHVVVRSCPKSFAYSLYDYLSANQGFLYFFIFVI